MFKKPFIALAAMLALVFAVPHTALASTGPWSWSDLSDKLIVRENRPVWAMARGEPYWYMTDGQDLYKGGHVWRTDGSIITDITYDVRAAGIGQIDDIVSDGQSIMFLGNIMQGNNSFNVILYNGSYKNVGSALKGYFNADEGISSIQGNSSIWMIITTAGRILKFNAINNTAQYLSLPNVTYGYSQSQNPGKYSVRHVSPVDGQTSITLSAAPMGNDWLFASGPLFYRYSGDAFTDVTSLMPQINFLHAMASNGKQILIAGGTDAYTTSRVYLFDGIKSKDVSSAISSVPFKDWNRTIIANNGESWIIISGKNFVRFDGTNFSYYGTTSDYFLNVAGSGDGRFLLGGAVSSQNSDVPSHPLTAKLARIDEGNVYPSYPSPSVPTTVATPQTYGNTNDTVASVKGYANQISYSAVFTPNLLWQPNSYDPKYTATGQSNYGISKIELYINGARQKVCNGSNSKKNVSCAMFIESTAYAYNTDVDVNARITNSKGKIINLPVRAIRFYQAGIPPLSPQSTGVTADMSVSPNSPYLNQGSYAYIHASGYAPDGLNRLELYVNGSLNNSCAVSGSSGTCDFTLNASNYTTGSGVAFNVHAVAANGQQAWSWLGNYKIASTYADNTNTNNNTYAAGGLSAWFDSNLTSNTILRRDWTQTIRFYGSSDRGLSELDLYANDNLIQTCTFNYPVNQTQSCNGVVYGNNYNEGQTVYLKAKATDRTGQIYYTSGSIYLTINSNGNNNNNSNSSAWFTVDPSDNTWQNNTNRMVVAYGADPDGLRRIEIFVNGLVYKLCEFQGQYGTQSCSAALYGSDYSSGDNVQISSRTTDINGNVVWADTQNFRMVSSYTSNGTVSVSVYPNNSTFGLNESFKLTANAYDGDNIRQVNLYANGSLVNTCSPSNNQTSYSCSANLVGSNYTNSSMSLPLQATVVDVNGNTVWSNTLNIQITGSTNHQGSINTSISPNKTSFYTSESFTYSANGSDADGIRGIQLYKDGQPWQYCSGNSQANTTCSQFLSLNNFSNGYSFNLQAKLIDVNGVETWSNSTQIQIIANQPTNTPATINITLNPDKTTYSNNDTFTYSASVSDPDGVNDIKLYANNNQLTTQSCSWYGTTGNCSASISASNFASVGSIVMQTKVVDNQNSTTWSQSRTVQVSQNSPNNSSITISSNADSGFTSNQQIVFTAQGSDSDGIGRIEIYVNASLVKTCQSSAICTYTGGPYSNFNAITYAATLYDSLGNSKSTGYKAIYKQ